MMYWSPGPLFQKAFLTKFRVSLSTDSSEISGQEADDVLTVMYDFEGTGLCNILRRIFKNCSHGGHIQ
jgi:hypothetical protein